MSLLNPFKLEKLKILVHRKEGEDEDVKYIKDSTIEVMFNPSSYSRSFSNKFAHPVEIGGDKPAVQLEQQIPEQISLDIIIDSTGVSDFVFFRPKSVHEQVEDFKEKCLAKATDPHDINFLILEWGDLNFGCVLASMNVSYSLFDNSGSPLRANINAVFIERIIPEKEKKENPMHSADITKVRTVVMGDTLLQLTKDMYGSYDDLFMVARANDLDQFRKLTPGMSLVFPSKNPNA